MNIYLEYPQITQDVIFEFVNLYGISARWNDEIHELFKEEVERRVKELEN